MGKTIFSPGGGQLPTRKDEKMSAENFDLAYPGYSTEEFPNHKRSLKKMLKKSQRKKRRQRDRDI